MRLEFDFDDYRSGSCDRCGEHAPVMSEMGPDAENVCRACVHVERERDYRLYRALLAGDLAEAQTTSDYRQAAVVSPTKWAW